MKPRRSYRDDHEGGRGVYGVAERERLESPGKVRQREGEERDARGVAAREGVARRLDEHVRRTRYLEDALEEYDGDGEAKRGGDKGCARLISSSDEKRGCDECREDDKSLSARDDGEEVEVVGVHSH